jgi:hypothetical protein
LYPSLSEMERLKNGENSNSAKKYPDGDNEEE